MFLGEWIMPLVNNHKEKLCERIKMEIKRKNTRK
jgi:hypothetical protein